MTDFGKFCVLLVVCALAAIIGGTIPHMPPPGQGVKVTPHLFAPRDDIITWDDKYEYIGEYLLTGFFPQECGG